MKNGCSNTTERKVSQCAAVVVLTIRSDSLDTVHLKLTGSHGPGFRPGIQREGLHPHVKQFIYNKSDENQTPSHISELLRTFVQNKGWPLTDPYFAPPLPKIQQLVNYYTRKGNIGLNNTEQLHKFLDFPVSSTYTVLWPTLKKDFPLDNTNWFIVLSNPMLEEAVFKFGSDLVGLDSVFKFSVEQFPLWLVVINCDGYGIACYFILGSHSNEQVLSPALQFIQKRQNSLLKDKGLDTIWTPRFMIDKDQVEFNAVQSIDCKAYLCQFHYHKTWETTLKDKVKDLELRNQLSTLLKVIEHSKSEEDLDSNLKLLKKVSPPLVKTWLFESTQSFCSPN